MHKQLFILLFASLFLLNGCKKDDSSSNNEFIINGIHDVDMSSLTGSILSLIVEQKTGTQQPVTISVTGLPSGISAAVSPMSGTPTFGTSITFTRNGTTTAGTFPIKIVGTSSTYTRAYDLNITVPAVNGWLFDNKTFSKSGSASVFSNRINYSSTDNGGGTLTINFFSTAPTADGTYTYKIVSYPAPLASNECEVECTLPASSAYFKSTGTSLTSLTVQITGGKYTITCPATELTDFGGAKKNVSIFTQD